jgi:hypothetical protein
LGAQHGGGGSLSGPFSVAAGASLGLDGVNIDTGATSSGAGTLLLSGDVTDNAALGVANVTQGTQLGGNAATMANAALGIAGTLTISGGEFDLLASGNSVGGFAMTGGPSHPSLRSDSPQVSLQVNGDFTWTGGDFRSSPPTTLTEAAGHAATISVNSSKTSDGQDQGWMISLNSPLSLSGGLNASGGGGITETAATTLSSGTMVSDAGNAGAFTVTSTGSLAKAAAAGTATIAVPTSLAGGVSVPVGTLSLGEIGTSSSISAPFSVAAGASLDLNGVSIDSGATSSGAERSSTTSP